MARRSHFWILLLGVIVMLSSCLPLVQGIVTSEFSFTSSLLTAFVIALLGWIIATAGALQWVRAEAARDIPERETSAPFSHQGRVWATCCHLSALLGYIIPFGHIFGPLWIWLAHRERYQEVEHQGRQALNLQLSFTLYLMACLILSFFLIGVVLLPVVVAIHVTLTLHASLKAQRGQASDYRLSLKFV